MMTHEVDYDQLFENLQKILKYIKVLLIIG